MSSNSSLYFVSIPPLMSGKFQLVSFTLNAQDLQKEVSIPPLMSGKFQHAISMSGNVMTAASQSHH